VIEMDKTLALKNREIASSIPG